MRQFEGVIRVSMAVLALVVTQSLSPARAQESCMQAHEAASANMASFDPLLAETVSEVKHVKDAGLDPNRYIVDYENVYVLLTVKLHALVEKAVSEEVSQSATSGACKPEVLPYRKMADVAMTYQHYGLGDLLPPEMARTNYLEVVKSGNVPTGSQAFMPQTSSENMQNMAIGGETAKMIKKPYCVFGACSERSPF
jgi:hypothetical protein